MAIPFPEISPIAAEIGSFQIRWYSLAYLFGILIAWAMVKKYCRKEDNTFTPSLTDDFLVWSVFAIILGGRLGYVFFYNFAFFKGHPGKIPLIWEGGMSFHGALLGMMLSLMVFCYKHKISLVKSGDILCTVAPIGLFLGRLANFVNGELYGRKAPDFAYAVVFPHTDGTPRHASQLYEAFLEGLLLFVILNVLWQIASLRKRTGLFVGLFFTLYALFRIFVENFREPDRQLGYLFGHMTMGQILCLPMLIFGISFIIYAFVGRK